jgi:cytochrome c-type biogenesis protein
MMDMLSQWLENSSFPIASAFILGLMTAIAPCPLATNISATAYIARHISDKRKVLLSGLLYTLGRATSYTAIGWIIYFGASKFQVARLFQGYGERMLGPVLILLGLILLGAIPLNFLNKIGPSEGMSERLAKGGIWGAFVLGMVFALAFCPYSGALFFSMLVPMTMQEGGGLLMPVVFAIGTGIPVILFTYLIVFSVERVGTYFKALQRIEKGMRYAAGAVFILAGLYYVNVFLKII